MFFCILTTNKNRKINTRHEQRYIKDYERTSRAGSWFSRAQGKPDIMYRQLFFISDGSWFSRAQGDPDIMYRQLFFVSDGN